MAKKNANLMMTPLAEVNGFTAIQAPTLDFNKENKEYQLSIRMNPEDDKVKAFISKLEAMRDEHLEAMKEEHPKLKKQLKAVDIVKPEVDDEGEETGFVMIKLKQRYEIQGKNGTFTKTVGLMDSRGIPITKKLRIGSGSMVKASFEPNPYMSQKDKEVGISFNRLTAVVLFKLEEYAGGGVSAASIGYDPDAEEDFDGEAFDATAYSADDQVDGDDASGGADEEDF